MTNKRYPRVDRVNEVMRQVLAEELERLADADDRLGLLTVTAVQVDPDLRHAAVLLASLSEEAEEALRAQRVHLQRAIARQMRIKRTPQLSFAVDPAIESGNRIEDLLRTIPHNEGEDLGTNDSGHAGP
jgi:ribosome-binding factor A